MRLSGHRHRLLFTVCFVIKIGWYLARGHQGRSVAHSYLNIAALTNGIIIVAFCAHPSFLAWY
jgi:hypothetical protein